MKRKIYHPSESSNLIVRAIQEIARGSGVILTTSVITNWVGGFVSDIDNRGVLYRERQTNIREIINSFQDTVKFLKHSNDTKGRACYSFCKRVYRIEDVKVQIDFMQNLTTFFNNDLSGAIERFSELEMKICKSYFQNSSDLMFSYAPRPLPKRLKLKRNS